MLERGDQLGELHSSMDEARAGAGRLVMVEGPAGIGKTVLLRALAEHARELGVTVLSASGDHLERDLPFGVVRMLFEPLLAAAPPERRAELLAGAARLAAPALALDRADASRTDSGPALFAVLHGLYWLCSNVTQHGPLLIVVDDAHWADVASLRWLAYLARRLEELSIMLALGVRPSDGDAADRLLATICAQPVARVIRPPPLSESAIGNLVGGALGVDAAPEFIRSCRRVTGGNPFLVRQLADALAADGVVPSAGAAGSVRRMGPTTVARAIVMRLAGLPAAAAALAQAVAIVSGADMQIVAALAGCDLATALEAADALTRVEILEYAPSLGFVHPIVQRAVYRDMGSVRRRQGHLRAARLLDGAGAEPVRVAVHLLATEPAGDAWAIAMLRAAAREARTSGSPDAAVTYLRRALAEPPAADLRAAVLIELGIAETGAMQLSAAAEHLTDALALSEDPDEQARAGMVLTPVLFSTGDVLGALALMESVIKRVRNADRGLATMLEGQLIHLARVELNARRLVTQRISLPTAAVRGNTLADKMLLVNLAVESVMAGGPAATAAQLAERALAGGVLAAGETGDVPSMGLATARVLTLTDRVELAGALLEDAIADAGTRGSVLTFATASAFRSELAYRLGALAKAGADAQAALQIAAEHEWQLGLPACAAYVIDTLIERDELVAAAEILRRHRLDDALPLLITCNLLLDSRGRLRIASGEVRDGLADLLECGRRMHDWGDCSPSHWRCGAALALLTLGDKQQARRLADEEFEYARAFGTPRAVGIALRVRGLVIGGDEGLELLQQAVRALADSCARLEHARALTDLGAALRRNGQRRAARDHLRLGLDLAHRCGATVVAGRAHDELTVSGARPRRRRLSGRDSLTPSEHRVAAMASAAMSNRDIAQALFVTVRTIETHLSHVYGKLDVHSREELAGALACEDADAANDDSLPDAAARAKHP